MCVLPLLLFTALAGAAVYDPSWDGHLRQVFLDGVPEMPGNDNVVNSLVSLLGASLTALTFGFFVLRKRPREALFWALAIAGAFALDWLLKNVVQRPTLNPASGDYAFPSGNAMLSMAVVMAGVLTAPMRWRVPLIAAGALFLIAFGTLTVESQAHYPSDVLAGWCVACAWTAGLWLLVIPGVRRPAAGPQKPPGDRDAPAPRGLIAAENRGRNSR
jgi:membrane-associated phospholipid phosphatase